MFLETESGYINTQQVTRLFVDSHVSLEYWRICAEMVSGEKYVVCEGYTNRKDAIDTLSHIISTINFGTEGIEC